MKTRSPGPESPRGRLALALAALGLTLAAPAAEFIVGPDDYETLQAAVDAAAAPGNLDVENSIYLREPVLFTGARVRVGPEFGAARHLVIRPDPSVPDLPRVTIVSQNGFQEILLLDGAGSVTVQDLDLVRHTTNAENLVEVLNGTEIVIERCRMGSDWPSGSLGEWSNLVIDAPRQVVVRNCVLFSRLPANLARGMVVTLRAAQNHSVFLYNNVVADFGLEGIQISAPGDSFVLLRNNIVCNAVSLTPEPMAYHSAVAQGAALVATHNTALAGLANVELVDAGAQSVAGAASFLRLGRNENVQAFREFEWKTDLGWNQNRNLFRLIEGGLLHLAEADAGVTVADGAPHVRDVAVLEDWELDPRPTGNPPRTDRGADQYRLFFAGDIEVVQPGIRPIDGASAGIGSDEGYDIIAVGPQDDFPDIPIVMAGGEYRVSGDFVSIAEATSISRLPRGTRYDGSSGAFAEFPAMISFDATLAMTVEAWVYRETTNRVETILSHDRSRSFWFGFNGPWLHFQRGPAAGADSVRAVLARRWTHVAAAYDGSRVKFYVDGEDAGSATLGTGPARQELPLWVGGDPVGLNLSGSLDEVRLWSVARSPLDIRGSMFAELPRAPGLVVALPSGAGADAVLGLAGEVGPGAAGQRVGILPRNLEIPKAALETGIQLDGRVHLGTEYLGAEELAIHYDDGTDAMAYLVYRDEPGDRNLYIGVVGLHDVPAERERSSSWVGVTMDPDRSMDPLATFFDFQVRAPLSADRAQFWLGDGQGGFANWDMVPGPNADWDVRFDFPFAGEFDPPTMEFRIARSFLGQWTDTDGLMMGHYDVAAPGDNYLAPNGTTWNAPNTWPAATYVENGVVLPVAIFSGHVYQNDINQPVANYRLNLKDTLSGEVLATHSTGVDGAFDIRVQVPTNRPLALELELCAGCLYLPAQIAQTGIQPTSFIEQRIVFPAAIPGDNRYAQVRFFIRQVGPIALTGFTPASAAPELSLRENPLKTLPGETVRIEGTNFHDRVQVYLYACPDLPPQDRSDCRVGHEIIEVPGANVVIGPDGTWLEVVVPHVPQEDFGRGWAWAVKDNWVRPGQVSWSAIGDLFGGDPFRLKLPAYPLVHGFEFDNEGESGTLQDFDGVFGNNAYICLGLLDNCVCRVRDPLYMLFYPIYDLWVTASSGSCNGMASTSLLFAHQSLTPVSFEEGVHFAAGFTGNAPRNPEDPPRPPKPGSYQDAEPCVPWEPRNLWAHIRVNHGVQTSAEFLQACLDQIEGGIFSTAGNPHDALDRVRRDPWYTVLSMVPSVGTGHVVTPYEVVDGVQADGTPDPDYSIIRVYDNNRPEQTNRVVEILPSNREHPHGQYRFEKADETWQGEGIYAIPLSIWQGERTAPGLLTALEAIVVLVFGDADGLYRGADGGEWGWRSDGTLVENLPGAKSLSPLGGGNTTTRNVLLALPATNPPPQVQINVRGSNYFFHAANQGRLLQLQQHAGIPGDTDQMRVAYDAGRLSSMRYTPQRPATNFSPRIGMVLGDRQRAVFEWSGLAVPGGSAAEFIAHPDLRGVELRNDTGVPMNPAVTVTSVDGPSANHGVYEFGSFEVPAGAIQRTIINDWPAATQLRVETDLDRDGIADVIQIATGRSLQPPPPIELQIAFTGNLVILSWPLTTDPVYLETSSGLAPPAAWTLLSIQPETDGQTARVTLPISGEPQFFRLRRP